MEAKETEVAGAEPREAKETEEAEVQSRVAEVAVAERREAKAEDIEAAGAADARDGTIVVQASAGKIDMWWSKRRRKSRLSRE